MIPIPTVLWWSAHDSRPGIARHNGVTAELHGRPEIEGLPKHMVEVHYWGSRGYARDSANAQEDLTREQCSRIEAKLIEMAALAAGVFGLKG